MMAISLFPRQIALSIVPTVVCLSETCGQRIVFLYTLLYLTKLTVKKNYKIAIGCAIFIGFLIELHLIYTIFPLLWHSLFYILLFGTVHFFVIMSTLWLIYDESFDFHEIFGPDLPLDESFRMFGYCVLPYLCTVICSWYLCTIYGLEYLPYYMLSLSFAQYRLYTTEPEVRNTKDAKYAAELHALIIAVFFSAPLATFLAKHAVVSGSLANLLEFRVVMEFFFLAGLSGLSASFLGLQPLLKHYIEEASIAMPSPVKDPGGLVRDASLVSAALLLTPALRAHGVRLHFYTGPCVALAAVAAVLLARGSTAASRIGGWACALVSAVAFGVQVLLFPWRIRYTLWDPTLMQRQFASILVVTALAPAIFVLLARRDKRPGRARLLFTTVFVAFILAFLYCEWNFYLLGHSSYHPVLIFAALAGATVAKLPDEKLPGPVKCCLLGGLLARCCLVLTHRLSAASWALADAAAVGDAEGFGGTDGGHREIYAPAGVVCLWLACLQAVWLLWRLPLDHVFYVGWSAMLPVSVATQLALLHALRPNILAAISSAALDRQLDYAEFIVLCLLLCGALHSRSLRATPSPQRWPPAKLLAAACWLAALAVGLVRNDFVPLLIGHVRLALALLQVAALCGLCAASWRRRRQLSGPMGIALTALLTFVYSLLYITLLNQPPVSMEAAVALLCAGCMSATFVMCLRATAALLRPALVLFACTILLVSVHLAALPTWPSFAVASFAALHQLLSCHWIRLTVRSDPDVVQLSQQLPNEDKAFNALLSAAYAVLLLIGCWNPLDNLASLSLPLLTLAWAGTKSRAIFSASLLASCQLAALYNVDFVGEDEPAGWWGRLVGLCEAALCLLQLPLHWLLVSDALANQSSSTPDDGSATAALIGRWLGGSGAQPAAREPSESDLFGVFLALLTMPLPVCLLLVFASSWQCACLAVATLLLGADYLANYRGYLADLLRASFAAFGDDDKTSY